MFVFQSLILIAYSMHRGLSPSQPDYVQRVGELAMNDQTGIFLQILALLPTHIFSLAMVWMLVTRFGKFSFRQALGWGWPEGLRLWRSVVLAIALFGLAGLIGKFLGADKPTPMEELINSSAAARYTIAVLAVLSAPFIEEFIYRGVLYGALHKLIGPIGASVAVLGLFTLIHVPQYWPNFGVIAAIGTLSVALTIVRASTGRLLPCIVIHLVFNAIASILLLTEPYRKQLEAAREQVASILHHFALPLIQ